MRISRRLCSVASSSSTTSSWDYDVMICGGGIVGAALASKILHMTGGTVKIGIIEPKAPDSLEVCQTNPIPDRRVYALSPKSIELLKSVNAWDMISERTRSYEQMQIWEMNGQGMLSFSSKDMNVPELGRIVEDRMIQTSLYETFKDYSKSIDCLFNSTVTNIVVESSSDGTFFTEPALLTYSTTTASTTAGNMPKKESKTIKCRLVVGADGGNSAVRRLTGIPSWGWSYGQTAVVSTVILDLMTSASVPPSSTSTDITMSNNYSSSSNNTSRSSHTNVTNSTTDTINTNTNANNKSSNNNDNNTNNIREMNQHNLINTTAYQTYLPTGPLALLPLWGNKASIVWSLPTPIATHMMKLSPEAFTAELNQAFQVPFTNQFNSIGMRHKKDVNHTNDHVNHHHHNNNDSDNTYAKSEYNNFPNPQNIFEFIKSNIFTQQQQTNHSNNNNNNLIKNPLSKFISKVSDEMIGFINTMSDVSGFRHPFRSPPLIETVMGEKAMFPLTLQQASHYVNPRIALVGDAAHSIHPQAGQGLNMGLQDVDYLAKVIVDGLASGSDIGSMQVLNKYGPASYYRNLNMLMVVNTINTVFSLGKSSGSSSSTTSSSDHTNEVKDQLNAAHATSTPATATIHSATPSSAEIFFRNSRSLGLIGVNSFDVVKKTITKYAMGI